MLVFAVVILPGCNPEVPDPLPAGELSPEPTITGIESQRQDFQIKSTIREKDGMLQLALPGGTFLMGSTEEEVNYGIELCREHYSPCNQWFYRREYPQHEVTLSPFLIDQSEVSNLQFQGCVDAGACSEPVVCKKGDPTYQDPEKKDHPVVCVDWKGAGNYCEWVGGRLPTEAEWEYAFRGEGSLIFPWGDDFVGSNLNYCDVNCDQGHANPADDDGFKRTAPVGSFPAGISWAGVQNLAGNVSEWVSDWYGDYGAVPIHDPAGPETGSEKMIKGCSWYSPAAYCRGASRPSVETDTRYDFVGFRCVQDPSPQIDGVLQPGEWDQAELFYFDDGSELYLMYSGDHLFLAIKAISEEMISGNVFLAREDKIDILHTSAALGTAIYQAESETWQKTKDFEWCCRSALDNKSARAMRDAFYATENWLGINSFNGNENELEYMISLDGFEGYLAVNFIRVDSVEDKYVWPEGVSDGPIQPTVGGFPEEMEFTLENWFALGELE